MMNEKLIAALSDIDDEMIADAAPGRQYAQTAQKSEAATQGASALFAEAAREERVQRRRRFSRIAAFAACFCVVVAVIAVTGLWRPADKNYARSDNTSPSAPYEDNDASEAPEKTVPASDGTGSGSTHNTYPSAIDDINFAAAAGEGLRFVPAGTTPGEGIMAAEDVPEKLAVYWQKDADPAGFPRGLDRDQMLDLLNMYAERLGMEIGTVSEVFEEGEAGSPKILTTLKAVSGNIGIEVDAGAHTLITMPEGSLPADVNSILQYEDPAEAENRGYRGVSYAEDSKGGYSPTDVVYMRSGMTITEGGDPLKTASVSEPVSGTVYLHIYDYSLVTEILDDLPVITLEQALEKLKAGEYAEPLKNEYTAFPGEEQIAGLRISYKLSPAAEYIAPYYVFTVMLPDVNAEEYYGNYDGLKGAQAYVEYYIPAIDERNFKTPPSPGN